MGTQAFKIRNEIPDCIMGEGGGQVGLHIRRRPAAATLVVEDHSPLFEVEQFQCPSNEPAAWPAVEHYNRPAVRISVTFIPHHVAVTDI